MDNEAGENNRLKTFIFPLLVPVAVFSLADVVGDGDALEGEVGKDFLKRVL